MSMSFEDAIAKLLTEPLFAKSTFTKGIGPHRTIARVVTRHMPAGAKILDFGAGACDKPAMLAYMGYTMYACDDFGDAWHNEPGQRQRIIEFARRAGVELSVVDEWTAWPWQRGEFDMVMMHDVLEHLHNTPRDLLNALMELIRPGGLLFVTVPNAGNLRKRLTLLAGGTNMPKYDTFYWNQRAWRGHVREYVRGDLVSLARFLGVEIVELRACSHMSPDRLSPTMRKLWQGVTSVCPGWRDSWYLVARKPVGWSPRMHELA